jgi:hypothetical protein
MRPSRTSRVAEHKAKLFAAKPTLQGSWQQRFTPGQEHVTPDGERVIADDRELIFLNHNGAILRREPNGEFGIRLPPLREQKEFVRNEDQRRRRPPSDGTDDALIETYLKHRNVTGYCEREARAVWAIYKQLTNGKPLKDASRDDGRKVVAYYEAQGLKSATVQKKIGWLSAAVNLAIDEGALKFNPFSSIVPERDDKQRRLPLSEADVRTLKQNLDRLSDKDQRLIRLRGGISGADAKEVDR